MLLENSHYEINAKLKYLSPIVAENQSRSKCFKTVSEIKHRGSNHVFAVINSEDAW